MNSTAVIVLHYLNAQNTRDCLESLIRGNYQKDPFKLIVVANSDENNFSASLIRDYPLVEVIKPKENDGFAAGNNLGIKFALKEGYQHLILLNNDTIVSPDLVSKITEKTEKDNDIGLLSPKIYFAKGFEYYIDKYTDEDWGKVIWYGGGKIDWANVYASHRGVDEVDRGRFDKEEETDFATGCCLYIRSEVVKKIGYLDEKYFMYFEDVDYSVRAKKKGFKVSYYPNTCLWHKNAASSGKPGSSIHIYYQTRNRLYFGMKYAPILTKKSLFLESIRDIFKDKVKRKAIRDFYFQRMGKGKI